MVVAFVVHDGVLLVWWKEERWRGKGTTTPPVRGGIGGGYANHKIVSNFLKAPFQRFAAFHQVLDVIHDGEVYVQQLEELLLSLR